MASKVFLLAIVLAAVAISECRPKTKKIVGSYGVPTNQQSWASGEMVNDSPVLSKYGNTKNHLRDNDSSSSESQEDLSQLSHGTRHMKQQNVYNFRRKLPELQSQLQNYQPGYSQSNGYEQQPQFLNQGSSPGAKPLQVQISGWQNPNQQSSEGNSQKYSFPRQVQQKADSDESSSSSEEGSQERRYRRQQAQARKQMYNKSNMQSSQQQSKEQTNPRGLDVSQQQSLQESMEIKKANKIIVKHAIGEVQGRTVTNQQRSRAILASSEEETEKKIISGGRNAIYNI